MASSEEISQEIEKILDEFYKEEKKTIDKCFEEAGKSAKRDVVSRSPGTGEYRKGWTVRTRKRETTVHTTVYNKDKPTLTHLLENSHIIRNQNGTYGRTSPGHGQVVHIKPAEDAGERLLLDLLKKRL